MSILVTIQDDTKDAMRAGDKVRVSTLRMLCAAIKNEMIALKKRDSGLSDDECIAVLKREAKKRKDAIDAFSQAGRDEQAAAEKAELEIIRSYLPEQMSEVEISQVIEKVIGETPKNRSAHSGQVGEIGKGDFGKVMGAVMKEVGNKAGGAVVSRLVKEKLG